jgi:probable rRNA maturation factor
VEITVLNRQRARRVAPARLGAYLGRLARAMPSRTRDSVAIALVSDGRMRALNLRFRGRDEGTDVLSFPCEAPADAPCGERHLGDIVIAVGVAARQARRARHSLAHELERLALHGYLHLLGFDHETDDGAMSRIERRLRRRLAKPGGGR